jgi:N-acylneuraminate cytidylyltransferase
MRANAIILARGGSKGILNKNIIDFCGHPLLAWTIMQAKAVKEVDNVWISSDDENILKIGKEYGAIPILRPVALSGDEATSESGWLHALDVIESKSKKLPEYILAPQVTSPLREVSDFTLALNHIAKTKSDSLMSVLEVEDFFMWKKNKEENFESINYDYLNRKNRQAIEKKYLENGSFYIFKSDLIRKLNNRLGGKIAIYKMPRYKMFQIDSIEDIDLCTAVMNHYNLGKI